MAARRLWAAWLAARGGARPPGRGVRGRGARSKPLLEPVSWAPSCEPARAPPLLFCTVMVGSLRCYQMALGAAGPRDDVMSISGPPGSARALPPGPLFPARLGWLFEQGDSPALALAGPAPARGGGAGEAEPGEAALCTRESITSPRRGRSPTLPWGPRAQTRSLEQRGVKNREESQKAKLEKQVFSSLGISPKYARVTNFLRLAFPVQTQESVALRRRSLGAGSQPGVLWAQGSLPDPERLTLGHPAFRARPQPHQEMLFPLPSKRSASRAQCPPLPQKQEESWHQGELPGNSGTPPPRGAAPADPQGCLSPRHRRSPSTKFPKQTWLSRSHEHPAALSPLLPSPLTPTFQRTPSRVPRSSRGAMVWRVTEESPLEEMLAEEEKEIIRASYAPHLSI